MVQAVRHGDRLRRSRDEQGLARHALLAASAAAYSTAGFFTRLIGSTPGPCCSRRGLFGGLFLAGVVVLQERGRILQALRAMGMDGILVTICSAVATVCFLNAMRLTSVADVMVVDAAIPFITAAMAWLVLGERESIWTLLATVTAFVGMAVMAGPAVARAFSELHGSPPAAVALVIVLIGASAASTWCQRCQHRLSIMLAGLGAFASPLRSMRQASACWLLASVSSASACCCWPSAAAGVGDTRRGRRARTPLACSGWLAFAGDRRLCRAEPA
jgi:drug/metabolite transporter (DMT)-like permease